MDGFITEDKYHIPRVCKKCGGVLIYQGVGEYRCEDCSELDYDDYGKVRLFIETHPGANAALIEQATGVHQKTIRQMLRDGRIQIAADAVSFLQCEMCGKSIRFGQFCTECETAMHKKIEENERSQRQSNIQGFGRSQISEDGRRRFKKND